MTTSVERLGPILACRPRQAVRAVLRRRVDMASKRGMAFRTLTLIDDGRPLAVEATVNGGAIRLSPGALEETLGWELKPQGLCRGDTCVPVRDRAALVHDEGIDLAALARLLDRPLAVEAEAGVAGLGASAA